MSDERFDRDLQHVLRDVAGGEASMSQRHRLADLIAEAPPGRSLWFTPPLRLSVAVVAAVAVLALAILFLPNQPIGPSPSIEPGISPPGQSGEPSTQPTMSPTQIPTTEPTLVPTPVPTPTWTTLSWVATSGPPASHSSWFVITDLLPRADGFLAGGWIGESELAFLRLNGTEWELLASISPPAGSSYESTFLAPVPGGVLSVARIDGSVATYEVRISADGSSWETVADPAWSFDWTTNRVRALAAGALGVVAIVDAEVTGGQGIVLQSADGRVWQRVELPASDAVSLSDVTAYAGGFVAVGRDGEPDTLDPVTGAWLPGTGRPAAWVSSDGVHWSATTVDGAVLPGAEIRTVIAGAEGLFATGVRESSPGTGPPFGLGTAAWVSTDGTTWRFAGELGADLPDAHLSAGDGTHMVLIGMDPQQRKTAEAYDWIDGAIWTSTDGQRWTRMVYEGSDAPRYLVCPPDGAGCGGSPVDAWVLPDGIAVAQGGVVPMHTILLGTTRPES